MTKKNNQIILTSRIITIALVTFAAVNGIFSTKLNAKASVNNTNDSTSHNDKSNNVNSTLVSANYFSTQNNSSSNNNLKNQPSRRYYNHKVNNITSNILLSHARYNSKAVNPTNNIEASSVTSTVHKHSEVRSSFTSSGNYYHSLSDVTSVSSSAQPEYKSQGASSGINKIAIQNRYPAEFQSLNNVYQSASMKVTISKSKASNANHYLSAYKSLSTRSYQNAFSWHHKSLIHPDTYQHHLKSQYQKLSSMATRIYRVSAGLDNANYLAKRINQINDPLYHNMINVRTKDDAESLTSINQSLAYNNQELSSANHALNENQKAFHNIHIKEHFMNLNHNSVWDQAFKDHTFINQVSDRSIPYNKHINLRANQIFKLIINNLAHKFNLNDLNKINYKQINYKYPLLHKLYLKNIILYADQNGNLIKITTGNQPVNIQQKYIYAFPLYNTDYSNFVNTLTNAAIKLNYSSYTSKNVTQANQIRQKTAAMASQLEPLKATNQLLTKKENAALNQWKLDSFLLSKPSQSTVFKQFYNTYLNKIINIDNQIYYGALGIGVYLFDPNINSFKLLIEKGGQSGTNLNLSSKDLRQIKQNINHNYEPKTSNKYQNMFQPNNIVLPNSIFKFLKSHNYQLANGQSVLRNIILCSVKFKKESGNLNLFIKFKHCNGLNQLNSLSDYNDLHEMIPILHNYYPLGNREITNATKSILNTKINSYDSLKRDLYSASNAVNTHINKYQASLSNFVNYSSINKELASAKYFASSYSSEIKSNQDNVSLAEIELDDFYVSHASNGATNSDNYSDNYSNNYQNWQHIPQYIHINSGLPIYNKDHHISHAKESNTLHIIGIGTNHNGRVFYKINNNHKLNYVPADSKFITNAYYPAQGHVIIKILQPTQVYRDANLTVPYKIINANTHLSGKIKPIRINSEKTIFKSKDGNYLPADTQSIQIVK